MGNLLKNISSLQFTMSRQYTRVLICCYIIVASINLKAQKIEWIKQIKGASAELGKEIVTDASGNTYAAGEFTATADFDPGVGVANLTSIGTGVEKLLEEVQFVFPDAKIASINSDDIKSFEDAEKIVKDISCGTIDIIIGTQMISKGYDFANLNLVGIVDADSMLYSSDLRALERAYQVFTQVMGRAGRRDESGKIIIQTFNPQNLLFEKIALDDKKDFYDFELNNRQQLNLPPFTQMARFEISALSEQEAKNFAKNLLKYFPINDKIEVFGPAPAPLQKLKNRHHFLIHLKVDKKVNLQKLINDITSKIEIPNKFRLRININPF